MVDGSSANCILGTGHAIIWDSYIAFMKFGMLNDMTGIFVDTAISVMDNDILGRPSLDKQTWQLIQRQFQTDRLHAI